MKVKEKVSKISVHYRPATGTRRCGNCGMYRNGACDLVFGKIDRADTCDKWVKRA